MKKVQSKLRTFGVREAGLEPACLSAPPPQDGASANFATPAKKARSQLDEPPRSSPSHGRTAWKRGKSYNSNENSRRASAFSCSMTSILSSVPSDDPITCGRNVAVSHQFEPLYERVGPAKRA